MRAIIAFLLSTLLTLQLVQAQQPPASNAIQQRIAALPAKAHVQLQLTDGNTLRGRIENHDTKISF